MKAAQSWIILALIALQAMSSAASQTGSSCNVIDDCPDLHTCQENVCVHKELFPITFREVGGTLFILFLNAVMTAGGVGAGAAYVPYIMLIFQYSLKNSIYIAYACVFGGGMGNLVNIITLKNPKTKRYMINFTANMIILPALMIGVLIGVLVSRMLPPFVTNLILLFVLGYSIFKNFFKLKANLAKEKKDRAAAKTIALKETVPEVVETPKSQESSPLEEGEGGTISQESPEKQESKQSSEESEENEPSDSPKALTFDKAASIITNSVSKVKESASPDDIQDAKGKQKELIMKRERRFPFHKLRELLINVLIIIVIGLIRGSKHFSPVVGVEWTCGWDFLWFGLAILAFLLALARSIYLVQKWQHEKLEVGYEFLPEEPLLDKKRTIKLAIGSVIAGIVGALVALGGAMIIGPILLDMHIPPAFSAATTGVFMIFSMFNAMFQTILDGHLSWQELVWLLPLSFAFSFISSKVVNWYVKRTGRQSTVILVVMLGAILGFVCLFAIFIHSLVEDFKAQVQFMPLC